MWLGCRVCVLDVCGGWYGVCSGCVGVLWYGEDACVVSVFLGVFAGGCGQGLRCGI